MSLVADPDNESWIVVAADISPSLKRISNPFQPSMNSICDKVKERKGVS